MEAFIDIGIRRSTVHLLTVLSIHCSEDNIQQQLTLDFLKVAIECFRDQGGVVKTLDESSLNILSTCFPFVARE